MSLGAGSVRLRGVGKRYTKYEDTPTLAYGLRHLSSRTRRSKLWAVEGVDLSLEPGESLGLVGLNGSGKSTLLQVLCGVTAPTRGTVEVVGRIAPLISVGVGFHPELTGRENVFVNATILGLSRAQTAVRLDEIVAFADIGDFLDTPVKFYSSGMFVRLGFAVAAHVDPELLVIDEVLAVGDLGFQVKCFEFLRRLRANGTTVVVVSHNMEALQRHCERGLVLDHGRPVFAGDIADAVGYYHDELVPRAGTLSTKWGHLALEPDVVELVSAELVDQTGSPAGLIPAGEPVLLRVTVVARREVQAPFLSIAVLSDDGLTVYRDQNMLAPFPPLAPGQQAVLAARIPLRLVAGGYTIAFTVARGNRLSRSPEQAADDLAVLSTMRRLRVRVAGRGLAAGIADLGASFEVVEPVDRAGGSPDADLTNRRWP